MSFEYKFDFERYDSPFQPGSPVSPEKFSGRHDTLDNIIRYARSASKGTPQHFFLTGERGMGKTSVAQFASNYIENNIGMTGIYVSNKGIHTVEELIDSIISKLLTRLPSNTVKDKVKELFGNIESLDFKFGKIKFTSGEENSTFMLRDFPHYLNELIKIINKEKGIFLINDDINGLSESKKFVDWYKNFSDTIVVDNDINLKLYVLFAGYPEKFDNLVSQEESFGRIFHYKQLDSLSDDEVKDFFNSAFESVDMKCDEDALEIFTQYSLGIPLMMQEIGDYSFYLTESNLISKNLCDEALKKAVEEIGDKQIRRFLNIINEYNYESILLKLAKNNLFSFDADEFKYELDTNEKNIFGEFIKHMVDSDIFIHVGFKADEKYKFNNKLFYSYFLIKAHLM